MSVRRISYLCLHEEQREAQPALRGEGRELACHGGSGEVDGRSGPGLPAGDPQDRHRAAKAERRSCETIVEAAIQSMRLDEASFRRYLGESGARNMSLLLATARNG